MTAETSFGSWLQQRRKALDLTQDALAQRIGCTKEMLRKIEADARRPSQQLAERLAETFGLADEQRPNFIRFARTPAGAPPPLSPAVIAALAPRAARQRHDRLPRPLTPLLGREHELAIIERRLIRDGVRLLTLIGPPGVGKTRLAIEAALALRERFDNGASFVELAAVSEVARVPATIARALGVKEEPGQPLKEGLRDYLRDRHLLLVLDNFEQLLSAAPVVAELLAECPWLTVLVTSRAALRVRGERHLSVPPLAVPADADSLEAVGAAPAATFFVERVRDVDDSFALTRANAAAVAGICTRLDGLPLALELAAARADLFTPQELLAGLSSRLTLLTDGPRDLPARQRTLRSTVEWSYALLSPDERQLFVRLGVFVGGASTEAIAAVCGPERDPRELSNTLGALIGHSMLLRTPGRGEAQRFTMLETLREYACFCLEASGEEHELRARHAAYYSALAEQADPHLRGAEQLHCLDRLEDDHANLRAALAWSADHDPLLGARLAGALHWFWLLRSHYQEGRAWLEAARGWAAEAPPAVIARVATGAGSLAYAQGDHQAAARHHEEALHYYEQAGDASGVAFALNNLGVQALQQVELERATQLLHKSLAEANTGRERWVQAVTHANLGELYHQLGDDTTAVGHNEASLNLGRAVGDRWIVGAVLHNLAEIVAVQGDDFKALTLYEESLAVSREWDDRPTSAHTLQRVGEVALRSGDIGRAKAAYRESLLIFWDSGLKRGIAADFEGLASVALTEGADELAAQLYGAAKALRERSNTPIWPVDRLAYDATVAALRARLPDERLRAAWESGSALSLEQAVALALN